jgi:hypothetical protein
MGFPLLLRPVLSYNLLPIPAVRNATSSSPASTASSDFQFSPISNDLLSDLFNAPANASGPGFLPPEQWILNRDFHKEAKDVKMEEYSRCKERWFLMDLKNNVCHQCGLGDGKNSEGPYLMGRENNMDPGVVPSWLPILTQMERC